MDVGTVTLNLVDRRVYMVATLPARVFVSREPAAVGALFTRMLKVGNGAREVTLQGVLVSPEEGAVFEARPEQLRLAADWRLLRGVPKMKLVASRPGPQGSKAEEVRWLAAGHAAVEFAGSPAPARAP